MDYSFAALARIKLADDMILLVTPRCIITQVCELL
jgi:hypothetical protein